MKGGVSLNHPSLPKGMPTYPDIWTPTLKGKSAARIATPLTVAVQPSPSRTPSSPTNAPIGSDRKLKPLLSQRQQLRKVRLYQCFFIERIPTLCN